MKLFQKYISPYMKQYKWLMFTAIFLGVITLAASSALQFASGYLITSSAEQPYNILMVYVPIVLVRAFGITRPISHYLERVVGHHTVLKILGKMRVKLYEALEPQALFIRSRFQTGDIIGTLADDIENLLNAYVRTIFPTIVALFLLIFTCIAMAVFDWLFAIWILFCLSILVFVYPMLSLYLLKKRQIHLKEKKAKMYRALTDTVFGISDWIISGKKHRFIKGFQKVRDESFSLEKKMRNWNYARDFQLRALSGLILITVGMWAGYAAQAGEILPTYIASFTLVTLPIIEGLIPVSDAIDHVPVYQESLQRIDHINQYQPEERDTKGIFIPQNPTIQFNHVSFTYGPQSEEALKNIHLTIPYGQKLALLGKSGAGKSTLIQLLYGSLEPNIGEVWIGDNKPTDYHDKIHEVLGILNQKPYLFNTTVENNIRLGKSDATREEIEEVIKKVKLDQYISSLPKGLDTQMEETGQRFSGGERQRIALARILLKNTPVVILDEPTVGLDPLTERDLLETIFTSLKDKTVILITHHLIGLEEVDKIVFLDQGRMTMYGSHHKLMKENERYRKLYLMDHGYEVI